MDNPVVSDWNQDDAIALRTFIAKNPRFLLALQGRRGKIEDGSMERAATTGLKAQGYEDALVQIKLMQLDQKTSVVDKTGHINP